MPTLVKFMGGAGDLTVAEEFDQVNQQLSQSDAGLFRRVVGDEPAALGTPIDPTKLSRDYVRPALKAAGIAKPFRPWHDLRHTALTHEAAAGNPHAYVQAKAGHSQSTITDRYIHAAQVLFPGAAEKAEERMFGVAG
jgi:integrase